MLFQDKCETAAGVELGIPKANDQPSSGRKGGMHNSGGEAEIIRIKSSIHRGKYVDIHFELFLVIKIISF